MAECVTPTGMCVAYNITNTSAYLHCDQVGDAYLYQWLFWNTAEGARYKETSTPYCYFDITEQAHTISVAYRFPGSTAWCGVYTITDTCTFPYPSPSPVIDSINWSPKGSFSQVAVGASYAGRSGTRFRVVAVSSETVTATIGGGGAHTYNRGDTFTLDAEGYTILHAIDDGECSTAIIAKNTSTNQHPSIGEEVSFAANVTWNDAEATATTRRMEWLYLKPPSESYTKAYADNLSNWTYFATGTIPTHIFDDADIIFIKAIARNKANQTDEFGVGRCSRGLFNVWGGGNGFEITVVDADGKDKLTIAEAELIPGTSAWIVKPVLLPFGVDTIQWRNVTEQTYLGISDPAIDPHYLCGQCLPSPSFCNLHTEVDKNYAVFRSTSGISVINGKYVHKLQHGRNTITVDRSLLSGLETTICGVLGLSGSDCTTFIAECNDVVFVGNYFSIMSSGKDMFGNTRKLTWFDHIALPFALLGTIAPTMPAGKFVSDGLKGMWKGGEILSSAASNWMKTVHITPPSGKIISDEPWTFMSSIVRISSEHLDEVMELVHNGNYAAAKTKIEAYLVSDLGGVPYRDFRSFNSALRNCLPLEQWEALMGTIYGFAPQADSIIKTASKSRLTADDIKDIAHAAGEPGVMDEVVLAVYTSLTDIGGASAKKLEELANILKNSPEISAKIGAKNVPMNRFVDSVEKYHDMIKNQLGQIKANAWFKNTAEIAIKALDSTDPAKMADIPHAVQDYAASFDDAIKPVGGSAANDIYTTASDFKNQPTSKWKAQGKTTTDTVGNKYWNWFNGLSDANQEKAVHGMVGAALVFALVILVKIYTDAGPQTLNHKIFVQNLQQYYWPCFNACRDRNATTLADAIPLYEAEISNCEASLEKCEATLKSDGTYTQFLNILNLHKFNLAHFKTCLDGLTPTGTIRCTSNVGGFYVWVDGKSYGHSYASTLKVIESVRTGTHTVKIEMGSDYRPSSCTKTVEVKDGRTVTFDCHMVRIGDCSDVTNVKIYTDPLSPVEGERISFGGSASSFDPINDDGYVWDFGDGSPDYVGQVMTHRYSRDGTYTVKLVVTNECGNIGSTTRAVVVKEEEEDTGTIRCTSNQSSFETFIDGDSVGSSYGTKLKVVSGVPVGSHEVKIEKGPGYTPESCTETVRVLKDDTVSVDCQMEKTVVDTATLTIQEVHGTDGRVIHGSWTVEIWVDGLYTKCQGAQTLTFGDGLKCDCSDPKNTPCEFGNHLITLKKAGYKDLSASVDIKAGDAKTWYSPVMEAGATGPPHDIDIVAPVGSTLRIDGIVITSSSLGRLITSLERLRR